MQDSLASLFERLVAAPDTSEYAQAFQYYLMRLGTEIFWAGPDLNNRPKLAPVFNEHGPVLSPQRRPSGPVIVSFVTGEGWGSDDIDVNATPAQWRGFVDAVSVFMAPSGIESDAAYHLAGREPEGDH